MNATLFRISALIDLLGQVLPMLNLPSHPEGWLRAAVTLVLWLLVAALALVALRLAHRIGERTATDYDEVLVDRMRAPIMVALVWAAIADLLGPWTDTPAVRVAWIVATIGLIYTIVWLVQRLTVDVVLHFAERKAASTATGMDDVLVPIAKSVVRPFAFALGTMLALEAAGLPIAGAALMVGGASFVLAFALQSTLEDIFGGVGLIVDTPFAPGDIIRLQDGTVCEVVGIGMRVTRLYDTRDHSIVTYANRNLVQEAIVNLTRPTPDMRVVIRVAVSKDSNTRLVWERLMEAGNAHPWVLGRASEKLPAMRRRMDRLVRVHDYQRAHRLIREAIRITAEDELNQAVEHLATLIVAFASRTHAFEHKGFDADERRIIEGDLSQLIARIRDVQGALARWLLMVRYTYVIGRQGIMDAGAEARLDMDLRATLRHLGETSEGVLEAVHMLVERHFAAGFARAAEYARNVEEWVDLAIDEVDSAPPICLPGAVPGDKLFFLIQRQEDFIRDAGFGAGLTDRTNGGIADLDDVEEYLALFAAWSRKMDLLSERVRELIGTWGRAGGVRLDEGLRDLRLWLAVEFREATPEWKFPRTPLVHIGDALEYELRAYVDNVRLSHFTRTTQVESQLRLDILHLLRDQTPAVSIVDVKD